MKYLYSCSFPVDNSGGKSRATFQKLKALQSIVGDLSVVDAKIQMSKIGRVFEFLRVEWSNVLLLVIKGKRPDVFISRGFCGIFSVPLAKILGVFTVREVHADAVGEASLTPYGPIVRKVIQAFSYVSFFVDNIADLRIFNHPTLLEWYQSSVKYCKSDVFVYNGADLESVSPLTKETARKKFNLDPKRIYLVFVGAASRWHGVEGLAALQRCFDSHGDPVSIICGGGRVLASDDPEGRLINIFPLDSSGCADLIQAADACLLSLSANRVSPGSPLKLYDYLAAGRSVITQEKTIGYSDEVFKYKAGVSTDFMDSERARGDVLNFINSESVFVCDKNAIASRDRYSWAGRMKEWVNAIDFANK